MSKYSGHPMRFKFSVEISRKTEEHITKHNLTRNDVRDALSGRVYFRKTLISGDEYWRSIAETKGRVLFIVLKPLNGRQRLITARDAEESEKRLYKKRRK